MKKGHWVLALVLVCGLLAVGMKICGKTTVETETVFFSEPVISQKDIDSVRISEGISIGGISVGGRTVADARSLLAERYSESSGGEVVVNWDGTPVSATFQDLGVSWGIEEALNIAAKMSDRGSGVIGYLTRMDLKYGNLQIEVSRRLDPSVVETFVADEVAAKYDIASVDATITREDGKFTVTAHENGRTTNQDATVKAILRAFYSMEDQEALTVDALIETSEPKYKAETLSLIQDRLGDKGTVYLDPDKERTERCINVEVATAYIDGTVLLPGESVSTSDLMKERIEENGYRTGGQMVNGQIEDSIGGGVCQVSTTLYNALLEAEIQIDQRKNHSMTVTYVKPSYDAAIATGSKDLVFTNNQEYPIYIQGYTTGHEVVFCVYGKEVRPANRTIEFVSVEDKVIESEVIRIEDPDLPTGSYEQTGSTHHEVWSHLDKIVYVDGVETERYTLHSDYYAPSQATIRVGTAPVETSAAETSSSDSGDSGSSDSSDSSDDNE